MPYNWLITPSELAPQLDARDLVLIDTRTPDDYAQGHIPNAIYLDVYSHLITDTRAQALPGFHRYLVELFGAAGLTGDERVVFYEQGTGMRATRGLWQLQYAGHHNVAVLHGGVAAWQTAGYPTTPARSTPTPSAFPLTPQPHLLATVDDIVQRLQSPDVLLLDVRRWEEYCGTYQQGCCPRSGRIPNAVWFEWDHILTDEEALYRDWDAVGRMLRDAGITPDKEIIPYCHRAARSSNTYLALKMLGYPRVRNYIGSWHEWSARSDLPMEKG